MAGRQRWVSTNHCATAAPGERRDSRQNPVGVQKSGGIHESRVFAIRPTLWNWKAARWVTSKPCNTLRKFEGQGEIVDSTELGDEDAAVSSVPSKRPKGVMKKPCNHNSYANNRVRACFS